MRNNIEFENATKDSIDNAFESLDDEQWEMYLEEIILHIDEIKARRGSDNHPSATNTNGRG